MKIGKIVAAAAFLLTAMMAFAVSGASAVPDEINVIKGEKIRLQKAPYIMINIDDGETVEAGSSNAHCRAHARVLGVLPVRTVGISFVERETVILCARPIGVRMHTEGVVVADMTDVTTVDGCVNPGRECGLTAGDVITEADGRRMTSAGELIDAVMSSDGRKIKLNVTGTDGQTKTLYLKPAYSESDGCWRAGIWIRSSTAGIGVMTFRCPESGIFGGLGHAICDESSGAVINASDGEITDVAVTETVRGASGAPGELVGFLGEKKYGALVKNTEAGIYGYTDGYIPGTEYEVALKQELTEGKAQIMADVPGGGGVQLYDVIIEKINYDSDNPTRNMIIRVTDDRLLNLTGGIVQGMSGSPVIQNGRFAAAVTHVFVNDPSMGYAIFAENMLNMAKSLPESTDKAA